MRYLLLMICFATVTLLSAQTGQIKGVVKDSKTGELLVGAVVALKGTSVGTLTDFEGNFVLNNLKVGTYDLVCTYISYEPMSARIVVERGPAVFNFILASAEVELGEVVKFGRNVKETESATLLQQKNATLIQENVGSAELSRKGISDVAAGVKKVAGVSMEGSKQLFVRGLGDRYNSAQLNFVPLSSPDPTKKIVKLDLFPSEIVKVLSVSKVFNVQNYADYTGALINIETRDYPDKPFISISIGTGYNTVTTGNTLKLSDAPEGRFLGLNTNERKSSMPNEAKNFKINQHYTNEIFKTSFGYTSAKASPSASISVSGGKLFTIDDKKIGVLASVSFDNDYSIRERYKSTLNRQGSVVKAFNNIDYAYGTNSSALLSLSFIPSTKSYYSYTMLFSNSGEDRLTEKDGRDDENNILFVRHSQFESHQLLNNILRGEYVFDKPLKLQWSLAYANAQSDIPDRRSMVLVNQSNNWYMYSLNQQETMRFFSEVTDDDINTAIKIQYSLPNEKGNIFGGVQTRNRVREFAPYSFYYNLNNIENVVVSKDNPEELLSSSLENGLVYINSGSRIADKYEGSLQMQSTYANAIYNVTEKFTVDAGVRVENAQQVITKYSNGGNPTDVKLAGTDFFPALSLKYSLTEKSNIRCAVSRTVTRPSFNEMSPSKIQAEVGEEMIHGNTNLVNSYSNNVDIKYELFPDKEDVISLAAYYKQLKDPIELTSEKSGGLTQYTFKNTPNGSAAGIEFEIKKRFNFLITGLNASYIYTHVQLADSAVETNKQRALQGASPYLVNADLGVELKYGKEKQHRISASFQYTVKGKRIWAVGADGIGDSYELPVNNLDMIIQSKLNNGLKFSLKVKNIFDSEIIKTQDVYDDTKNTSREEVYERYTEGLDISFGLAYTF